MQALFLYLIRVPLFISYYLLEHLLEYQHAPYLPDEAAQFQSILTSRSPLWQTAE